ncbi:Proprotein convertase subtilisin/kexin type 7 [Dinochytrium kinnereticum]|nr:Proprotein convertase subtilisin/kexin type 7 [Dinochytrium kinnereticum]
MPGRDNAYSKIFPRDWGQWAYLIPSPCLVSNALGLSAGLQPAAHGAAQRRLLIDTEAEALAREHGLGFLGQVGGLDGFFLFEGSADDVIFSPRFRGNVTANGGGLKRRSVAEVEDLLLQNQNVRWFEKQKKRRRYRREHPEKSLLPHAGMNFYDPKFALQWHLFNDGVNGFHRGHDINVIPVWKRGINGTGITVAIIDDGVEYTHPDFDINNWSSESSYDFNERTNTPLPQGQADVHGTRCAGEIAASPNNYCGVGVAFGVRLAGERLISESTTDAVEAQALNYKNQINDIYSSSWGPNDDGASLDGPGYLGSNALIAGVERGRGGKGSIFVFASGNGGLDGDNCNFDGYANSVYTVSIGAIDSAGKMPPYGEICAAHLGVTYSGGGGTAIVSDVLCLGNLDGKCTGSHSGTSAAAPIASGIIALMLSARPDLRWRDVQQLIFETAQMTDEEDPGWTVNGAGRSVSHKYGFGRLDADRIVRASEAHHLLPIQQSTFSKTKNPNIEIPLSDDAIAASDPTTKNDASNIKWVSDSMEVTTKDLKGTGLSILEHVQLTVRIRHPERRHLTIHLTSPSGTSSVLATPRLLDNSTEGFNPWTFMTVRCWGENPIGTWRIMINDARKNEEDKKPGELLGWSLTLRGTCSPDDRMVDGEQRTSRCPSLSDNTFGAMSVTESAVAGITISLLGFLGILALIWSRLSRPLRRKRSPLFQFSQGEGSRQGVLSRILAFVSGQWMTGGLGDDRDFAADDETWGDIESPVGNGNLPFSERHIDAMIPSARLRSERGSAKSSPKTQRKQLGPTLRMPPSPKIQPRQVASKQGHTSGASPLLSSLAYTKLTNHPNSGLQRSLSSEHLIRPLRLTTSMSPNASRVSKLQMEDVVTLPMRFDTASARISGLAQGAEAPPLTVSPISATREDDSNYETEESPPEQRVARMPRALPQNRATSLTRRGRSHSHRSLSDVCKGPDETPLRNASVVDRNRQQSQPMGEPRSTTVTGILPSVAGMLGGMVANVAGLGSATTSRHGSPSAQRHKPPSSRNSVGVAPNGKGLIRSSSLQSLKRDGSCSDFRKMLD